MTHKKETKGTDWDPNSYIIWEGPNAESLQFWEDDWHDRHDDMSQGHEACPDCGHDLRNWKGWSKTVHRHTNG